MKYSPANELEQKIHSSIPISHAMQFQIVTLDDHSIRVHAPLAPNVNIHGTGFAGSIYSLAVLSGWALCMHIMKLENMQGDLVVGKAEIKYRSAVNGDIDCKCSVAEDDRKNFISSFNNMGKSKLELEVIVGDSASAVLLGTYFAIAI